MEDTSFIDLLKEENLSKIDIDPRLMESFKNVLKKMQAYFNANGYTGLRNYAEFFEEFLLTEDKNKKLPILLNKELSEIKALGFYSPKGIAIDESCVDRGVTESVLCHEFIHFIVMRGIHNDPYKDANISKGGFVNEALTEMLTNQIYPESRAYRPQVKMMEFANLLENKVNNYSTFLDGYIPAKSSNAYWWNDFIRLSKKYQDKNRDQGYNLEKAVKDQSYIDVQRSLIDIKVNEYRELSFKDYKMLIDKFGTRPIPDLLYMDTVFQKL